jgi:IPT/TIG domain
VAQAACWHYITLDDALRQPLLQIEKGHCSGRFMGVGMSSINSHIAAFDSPWRAVARVPLAALAVTCLALLGACGGSESDPPASAGNQGRAQALAVPNPNAFAITGILGYGTNRNADGLSATGTERSAYPINNAGYVAVNRAYTTNGAGGLDAFELTRDGVAYEFVPTGNGVLPGSLDIRGQAIDDQRRVIYQRGALVTQPVFTYGLFDSRFESSNWVSGPYSASCECYFTDVFVNAAGEGVALAQTTGPTTNLIVLRIAANGSLSQLAIDPQYLGGAANRPRILADGTIYVGVLNYGSTPQAYQIWRFVPGATANPSIAYSLPVGDGAVFSWDVNEQGVIVTGEVSSGGASAVIKRVVAGAGAEVPGTLVPNSGALYDSVFVNQSGLIAARLSDQSVGFAFNELIYIPPGKPPVRALAKDDLLAGAKVLGIHPTSSMNETGQLTIYTSLDVSPEPNPARNRVSIVTPLFPAISALSPLNGPIGTTVNISGARLATATAVAFNGIAAAFTVNSDTELTATVPAGATSGPVTVTTPAGSADSASFTVTTQPAPTVAEFTPMSGAAGTRVTISGTGFLGATEVRFNGVAASFSVQNDTTIRARVPTGAVTGPVAVTTPGGTANSANAFIVPAPPMISNFSPASGPVGTTVNISGSGLATTNRVLFAGRRATFTVLDDNTLSAVVPNRARSGSITVQAAGGSVTSSSSFTVTP